MLNIETTDRFMREPEVERVTGLSRTTRWRLQRAGEFPLKRQISPNATAWLASEIFAWMAEKTALVEPRVVTLTFGQVLQHGILCYDLTLWFCCFFQLSQLVYF